MNLIVLIDKLLINLCFEYKYVLLLKLTEKKITIFLSVGILEHSLLTNIGLWAQAGYIILNTIKESKLELKLNGSKLLRNSRMRSPRPNGKVWERRSLCPPPLHNYMLVKFTLQVSEERHHPCRFGVRIVLL